MRRALIGHTGFVGANLAADGGFTDLFNSANIGEIAGNSFDDIVCAGVYGVKWLANQHPNRDWTSVLRLLDALATVRAGHFTLISTIDVYPDPSLPYDESLDLRGLNNHAYGRHRLAVEAFVTAHFDNVLIARLATQFGRGLKKNIIFDLLAGHETEKINPATSFQWYPVHRLRRDLETARTASLSLVNLFPQALATGSIIERFFPDTVVGPATIPAPTYDLRTRHSDLFGGPAGYALSAGTVFDELARFVNAARRNPEDAITRPTSPSAYNQSPATERSAQNR